MIGDDEALDDDACRFRMAYCLTCGATHAFGIDGFSGAPLELPACKEGQP